MCVGVGVCTSLRSAIARDRCRSGHFSDLANIQKSARTLSLEGWVDGGGVECGGVENPKIEMFGRYLIVIYSVPPFAALKNNVGLDR